MTPEEREQQIGLRTQAIITAQISELVLTCARLRAENEALHAAIAVAERRGTGDGAQGADGLPKEGS